MHGTVSVIEHTLDLGQQYLDYRHWLLLGERLDSLLEQRCLFREMRLGDPPLKDVWKPCLVELRDNLVLDFGDGEPGLAVTQEVLELGGDDFHKWKPARRY